MKAWFKALSLVKKTVLLAAIGGSIISLGTAGASAPRNSQAQPNIQPTQAQKTPVKAAPAVIKKTETQTKVVSYQSSTVEDANVPIGITQTRTVGVNGVETITYEVTTTNGQETSRTQTSDVVTTQPINEVLVKGTQQPAPTCPNGSYTNSAGNTVCSPYQSNSIPADATAQCADGSYSSSQSRSGTCSHHGGVAQWL